jgi:hypothetical protein
MDENNLKRFFRTRHSIASRRRLGCMDESQIAAYADHQITGREKERAESHLADCDYCLGQLTFLVQTQNAGPLESPPDLLLARARKLAGKKARDEAGTIWLWGKLAAASAAACLVLVTVISLRQSRIEPPVAPRQNPVTRPSQTTPPDTPAVPVQRHPAVRGGQNSLLVPKIISPAAGSTIQADQFEFRWEPISGAREYEVEILSEEGDLIWKQRVVGSSIRLPGGVGLEASHKYFVTVRGYLEAGSSVLGAPISFTVGQR